MPSYSDSEMRAIVGRALQIDTGRSDRFTPEQLRTIAAELGISSQALEVAMYEADSKGTALLGAQPTPRGMPGWAKGVAVAVGALMIAMTAFVVMRSVNPRRPVAPTAAEQAATPAPPAPARAIQVEPSRDPVAVKKPRTTTKKQF
jgi:hypothetical protein